MATIPTKGNASQSVENDSGTPETPLVETGNSPLSKIKVRKSPLAGAAAATLLVVVQVPAVSVTTSPTLNGMTKPKKKRSLAVMTPPLAPELALLSIWAEPPLIEKVILLVIGIGRALKGL